VLEEQNEIDFVDLLHLLLNRFFQFRSLKDIGRELTSNLVLKLVLSRSHCKNRTVKNRLYRSRNTLMIRSLISGITLSIMTAKSLFLKFKNWPFLDPKWLERMADC